MTDTDVVFSVIIPAYNASNTIERAVLSVVNQNFSSYEIIIVDDGSTDDTLDICKKIALNNHYIKLFSKKNGGVSSARNYAINKAVGEYVIFLDSDDIYLPGSLETIFRIIKDVKKPDLILCGYKNHASSVDFGVMRIEKAEIHSCELFSNDNNLNISIIFSSLLFSEKYTFQKYHVDYPNMRTPWAKAYRREVLIKNDIKFDEKMYRFEDGFFNMNVLFNINSIAKTELAVYGYIQNESGSIQPRKNIVLENYYKIRAIDQFLEKQNNKELNHLKNYFYLELLCGQIIDQLKLGESIKAIKTKIKQYPISITIKKTDLRYCRMNKKISYILYKTHLYLFLIMMFRIRIRVGAHAC